MVNYSESFLPIVGDSPRILVLGTLPGKESLRANEYYANSRNLFWKILYGLFNTPLDTDYRKKIEFLKKNRIAIWDVCKKAMRQSSLDSDITEEKPNSLTHWLEMHSTIETIVFNGQKAEKLYNKYFERIENMNYFTLLSTSPANASYSYERKISDWEILTKPNVIQRQ